MWVPVKSEFFRAVSDKFSQGKGEGGSLGSLKTDFFKRTHEGCVVIAPEVLVRDVGRGEKDRSEGFQRFLKGDFRLGNPVKSFVRPNDNREGGSFFGVAHIATPFGSFWGPGGLEEGE